MKETSVYDVDGNVISSLVQWDINVPIYLNESDLSNCGEIHFFHNYESSAYVVEPSYDGDLLCAYVPNILLQEGYTIYGYTIASFDDTLLSMYYFKIPVRKRPKPDTYVYSNDDSFVDIVAVWTECKELAESADTSATNAAVSEANAATSESNAAASEANAATSESNAAASEANAKEYMNYSKSYAIGTDDEIRDGDSTDNASYYYDLCKRLANGFDGEFIYMGSITYSDLLNTDKVFGYVYTVTDEFISDDTFIDGSGLYYHAGTNVLCTNDGYWDCMSGGIEDVEEEDIDTIFEDYSSVSDSDEDDSNTLLEDTITDNAAS